MALILLPTGGATKTANGKLRRSGSDQWRVASLSAVAFLLRVLLSATPPPQVTTLIGHIGGPYIISRVVLNTKKP